MTNEVNWLFPRILGKHWLRTDIRSPTHSCFSFGAFVLASVSLAFAQSPAITFYETADMLRFEAEDVVSIQYVDEEEYGEIVLALSAAMSQRLQAFTERLVGRTIMTVSRGHVLSADISVRTAISGPAVHFTGSEKAVMRHMAERLEGLRNSGEPLLVTYKQVAKLDIDAARITLVQDDNDRDEQVLRVAIYDAVADDIFDALPTEPTGWIAVIVQHVVDDWSISNRNGLVDITLRALTPAQCALVQSSVSGEAPAPE